MLRVPSRDGAHLRAQVHPRGRGDHPQLRRQARLALALTLALALALALALTFALALAQP